MVNKYNAENERIKRKYFGWMREAQQCSEATVDAIAKALSRFEEQNRYKSFKVFHHEQARAFKRHLADQISRRSGEKLSKATLHATLTQLRRFFRWLADQPGYKSRFQHSDADYFNPASKDSRIAMAQREQKAPTLEQVRHVIEVMPNETEIERRNRALVSFALLTGARDGAIASLKLKHIDVARKQVIQDAREVKTKFSKTFPTFFFPVGPEPAEIFERWVRFLIDEKLWGDDDPLFPATRVALGKTRQFEPCGLERNHWKTATPIRKIFRDAFERAGLPYFHPHSLRHTLTRLSFRVCRSPEQIKAWSQNLGHEHVMTTLANYGTVTCDRQGEIFRELATPQESSGAGQEAMVKVVMQQLHNAGFEIAPRAD